MISGERDAPKPRVGRLHHHLHQCLILHHDPTRYTSTTYYETDMCQDDCRA